MWHSVLALPEQAGIPRPILRPGPTFCKVPSPNSLLGLRGPESRMPTRASLSGDSVLGAQEKVRAKNVKMNSTAGSSK